MSYTTPSGAATYASIEDANGTVRHLTGNILSPFWTELRNGTFVLKAGSRILMAGPYDQNKNVPTGLIVGAGATLLVQGGTITAACDDMWDAIYVQANSGGICFGTSTDDLTTPLPTPVPNAWQLTTAELSHSLNGIVVARPDLTPVRLLHTRVYHNRYGVQFSNLEKLLQVNQQQSAEVSKVTAFLNTDYTGEPAQFKRPYAQQGTRTHEHLALGYWQTGTLPIAGNRFGNCLVDISIGESPNHPGNAPFTYVTVGPYNHFQHPLLAGVYNGPSILGTLSIEDNTFEFAPRSLRPTAARLADFFSHHPTLSPTRLQTGTAAIFLYNYDDMSGLFIRRNAFTQPVGFGTFPTPGQPDQQAGIEKHTGYGLQASVEDNAFTNLAVGVDMKNFNSVVKGNTFTDCAIGAVAALAAPYITCNTFIRSVTTAGAPVTAGINAGIWVPFWGRPLFDQDFLYPNGYPGDPQYLRPFKNLFLAPPATTANRMWYLQYDVPSGQTPTWYPKYIAYVGISGTTTANTATNIYYNLLSDISNNSSNFVISNPDFNAPQDYDDDSHLCALTDNASTGFNPPRSAPPTPPRAPDRRWVVAQNAPNPVQVGEETSINYELGNATSAELTLYDGISGREVRRVPLNPKIQTILTLSTAGLNPGLYTYTVTADGRRVATRRLVVSR